MDKKQLISDLLLYLNKDNNNESKIILIDEATIEKEEYYVFFYNTEKYIKEKDLSYALAGNAPIIINKRTGEKYITGTAHRIEYYLEEYERNAH